MIYMPKFRQPSKFWAGKPGEGMQVQPIDSFEDGVDEAEGYDGEDEGSGREGI